MSSINIKNIYVQIVVECFFNLIYLIQSNQYNLNKVLKLQILLDGFVINCKICF